MLLVQQISSVDLNNAFGVIQICDVRSKFEDEDRVGGEVFDGDKTMILGALKDGLECQWIDAHQALAALEDFDEKISGQLFLTLQAVSPALTIAMLDLPITSEIWTSADKRLYDHGEL